MSGHVVAAAEAAARLKLETYESTFEVEAPGTGRLGVAFRDSSELWTVTPGGALHRLGVYPGCLLLRANGRPCGATDESALQALEAAAADGDEVRVLLFARPPPPQVPGECRAPRRSPPAELLRGDDGRGRRARTSRAVWKSTSVSGAPDNSPLRHFSEMTRPSWLGRAVRNSHRHAVEQASRRWRGNAP